MAFVQDRYGVSFPANAGCALPRQTSIVGKGFGAGRGPGATPRLPGRLAIRKNKELSDNIKFAVR